MEQEFKEGYYWVNYGSTQGIEYFKKKNEVFSTDVLLQYLGKDYYDFLSRFKIKAS